MTDDLTHKNKYHRHLPYLYLKNARREKISYEYTMGNVYGSILNS